MSKKNFFRMMIEHSEHLQHLLPNFEELYNQFKEYNSTIPTYGAIILHSNLEDMLLVKSFFGNTYGFPKGKVNEKESQEECAIREVWEEVGVDISYLLDSNVFLERICERTGQY